MAGHVKVKQSCGIRKRLHHLDCTQKKEWRQYYRRKQTWCWQDKTEQKYSNRKSNRCLGREKQKKYRHLQGFGAGAARSRGIWLEPEPSLWPASGFGSGSSLTFSLIINANCMEHNCMENNLYFLTIQKMCKKIPVCPPSRAGAGSRKKIPGAGAAPKQAGSETLVTSLTLPVILCEPWSMLILVTWRSELSLRALTSSGS